jgi:hypothetical protein
MDAQRETKIRQWILATVSNGGIERLDDLHVDDIDEDWQERKTWVAAGLTAYRTAVRIRSELGLNVTVALAFSLVDEKGPPDTFETQEDFQNQIDWSPPSLYLFCAGDQRHLSANVHVNPLPKSLMSQFPYGTRSFLLRWIGEDGNHRRSVFVEA